MVEVEEALVQALSDRGPKGGESPSSRRPGDINTLAPFDFAPNRHCALQRSLLGVVHCDLVYNSAISVLHQTHVNLGIFLNISCLNHFSVGGDDLDSFADDEAHRLARPGVESDRRLGYSRLQFPNYCWWLR